MQVKDELIDKMTTKL
jgi:hypothetical protein